MRTEGGGGFSSTGSSGCGVILSVGRVGGNNITILPEMQKKEGAKKEDRNAESFRSVRLSRHKTKANTWIKRRTERNTRREELRGGRGRLGGRMVLFKFEGNERGETCCS